MIGRAIATVVVTTLAILAGAPALGGISLIGERDGASRAAEGAAPLESIALLPSESRTLVLEASLHPDLLEALAALHGSTNRQLSELTSDLSDQHRQMAWLILAHPELVSALTSAAMQPGPLLELLSEHPEPVAAAGRTLLRENPELVREISALQSRASTHFESLLERRSLTTQITYRRLLAEPRALSLVVTQQGLLRSLGVLYRNDAAATRLALDQIAEQKIAEHADVLPGWQSARAAPATRSPSGAQETLLVETTDSVRIATTRQADAEGESGEATLVASVVTTDLPPPASIWLGGCATTPAGSSSGAGRYASGAPAPRPPVVRTSTVRRRPQRPIGGGSVVVWPRPGSTRMSSVARRPSSIPIRGPRFTRPTLRVSSQPPSISRVRSSISRQALRGAHRSTTHSRRDSMNDSRSLRSRPRKGGRRMRH